MPEVAILDGLEGTYMAKRKLDDVETIDFPAIEDLLEMEGFLSKYNLFEDLAGAGANVSARLAYDLGKLGLAKIPKINGPEWYWQLLRALALAGAGSGLGYMAKQRINRDAGLVFASTVLGGVFYESAVVPLARKILPLSISGALGAVEVEERTMLGALTSEEEQLLLSGATTVEEEFRGLGTTTTEERLLGDAEEEVVLGGGFNMNHGSLAAVLSY